MNTSAAVPDSTVFHAVTQLVSAAFYAAVGFAALAHAPRDIRTRVFCALGLMHAVAFTVQATAFFLGIRELNAFDRIPLAVTLSALSLGALAMFHFSQVFPARRPWIRASGVQFPVAYALVPAAVFALVRGWPDPPGEITGVFGLLFVVFGFPLMVLLGLVLPVASIVSFLRSLREMAAGKADARARRTIVAILVSQLGGGFLAIFVLAPVSAVAPESFVVGIFEVAVWLLGLLTPLAFALAVWQDGVLAAPPASAEVQPD